MLPVLQGCPPRRAEDPAALWGNPFALGVSLQFMTKREQPWSPCATEASPALGQQSTGSAEGRLDPIMDVCQCVRGFVPVKREPEQNLCIAVPTELGPSRDFVSSSRARPLQPRRFPASPKRRGASGKERPRKPCRRGGGRALSLPRKMERCYSGLPQPTDTSYNSLFPFQTSGAGRVG